MTAQCKGMEEVGSARYKLALLPPCPSIKALCYSNCQRSTQSHQQSRFTFSMYYYDLKRSWQKLKTARLKSHTILRQLPLYTFLPVTLSLKHIMAGSSPGCLRCPCKNSSSVTLRSLNSSNQGCRAIAASKFS